MAGDFGIEDILPGRTDRVFVTGQTGSGKTTLVQVLLRYRKHVVVYDAKGQMRWPGYTVITDFNKLSDVNPEKVQRIIYKPSYAELSSDSSVDAFFRWVYYRRHCVVYVDELASVTDGNNFPFHYGACLMRGRELGIEVISGTQRPTSIPQIAMSEAEHHYIFKLRLPQDRMKIENVAGIPVERIAALNKRQFLYAPQDGEIIGPLSLELDSVGNPATNSLHKVS